MPSKNYQLKPLTLILHDEASVKFHVKNDDYFGTIATIISLLKQALKNCNLKNKSQINLAFKNLEKDLMFLQRNYEIKAKSGRVSALDKRTTRARAGSSQKNKLTRNPKPKEARKK